ncbi:MAG TPA: DUF6522 family protein [Methylocystis sp.]|nr:DUF6522 family protein [Methylocystis sp.]
MSADAVNPSSSLLGEASAPTIAFEDDAVQVPAAVIAYGFDLETPMVQSLMRSGELTSLCEKGENEDVGRYRLTFFYKNRRLQCKRRFRPIDFLGSCGFSDVRFF